ncbi:hypothetical protein ACIRQP_35655 [Streptomyces sp. NPDC102274]|uniref:hypothetical protein n=1 Tax=Streptomyces sp. NPDC102274 TaxID=3366151 RepID=UPI0037FC788F
MSGLCDETIEQQAYITRSLLDYTAVPLVGRIFLRGVLPTQDAVRIVTGSDDATAAKELIAYEIPLSDDDDEPVTAPLVLGWTRKLASGGIRTHSEASVMGMALVRVDTSAIEPAPRPVSDRALGVLRTLAWPFVETPPSPALCGFLFTGQDTMRLYLAVETADGLIAADVRLSSARTALLASLPALVCEEGRWETDTTDPHCLHVVDLTSW